MNKELLELLERIKIIHEKKAADYTDGVNIDQNFERSSIVSEWYNAPLDKVFATLVTTKLARLATLLNSNAQPNNESIDDSFLDLTTYCALWRANYKRRSQPTK